MSSIPQNSNQQYQMNSSQIDNLPPLQHQFLAQKLQQIEQQKQILLNQLQKQLRLNLEFSCSTSCRSEIYQEICSEKVYKVSDIENENSNWKKSHESAKNGQKQSILEKRLREHFYDCQNSKQSNEKVSQSTKKISKFLRKFRKNDIPNAISCPKNINKMFEMQLEQNNQEEQQGINKLLSNNQSFEQLLFNKQNSFYENAGPNITQEKMNENSYVLLKLQDSCEAEPSQNSEYQLHDLQMKQQSLQPLALSDQLSKLNSNVQKISHLFSNIRDNFYKIKQGQ